MSFRLILYLSAKIFEAKIFSRALLTETYYFLIVSICIGIFSLILVLTVALSCLLVISLNNMPSFIFETMSANFILLPNISFSRFIKISIYSMMSALGMRNRMQPIFTTLGCCICCTPILILYLSRLYFALLVIFLISLSCTMSMLVNTRPLPFLGLPLEKYFCIYISDSSILFSPEIYSCKQVCNFLPDTSKSSLYYVITTIRSADYTTFINFLNTILYLLIYSLSGGSSSTRYKYIFLSLLKTAFVKSTSLVVLLFRINFTQLCVYCLAFSLLVDLKQVFIEPV